MDTTKTTQQTQESEQNDRAGDAVVASKGPSAESEHTETAKKPKSKLWSVTFVILVAISFFLFVTGQGINGGLSVYVERVGGTSTFAGILSAAFSVAAAVTRLALGPVIDTRGRMIVATLGSFVLFLGIALAGLIVNDAALTAARIIQGIGFAAATTAASTAAADVLPSSRMGEGIGYFGLGQAVAMSFGPALALAVLSTDPPQNLFVVTGLTTLVALALAVASRYERKPSILPEDAVYRRRMESGAVEREHAHGPSEKVGLRNLFEPCALPGAMPQVLMSMAIGFAISFVGLYGEKLGAANAGLFFTLSAVSMIGVRVASKSFMDVMLPISIYTITIISGVISFTLLIAAQTMLPLLYVAGLFYGVFLGLGSPINQSVAVKNTPPERWGATNALVLLANDVGIGGASLIWGIVNDTLGFSASIIGSIVCMAVSYACALVFYPKEAKHRKRAK